VVPADVLLLSGSVVVNEAMLTGESIPQLKEAAAPSLATTAASAPGEDPEKWLQGLARNMVLAGTSLVSSSSGEAEPEDEGGDAGSAASSSAEVSGKGGIVGPRGGAVGFVLRTGFYTSQGDLMRTIMFSTRRVTIENKDAYLFIAGLLVFALAAAAYVLREGLSQEGRDTWKLTLHCILVVTSVVPPELPVELSMAVNNSLAALARKKVFCTEPFRIPNAGMIDACCFDKTGTLTSDQLLVRGVAYCSGDAGMVKPGGLSSVSTSKSRSEAGKEGLLDTAEARSSLAATGVRVVPANSSHRDSWTVMAGCHAVVMAEGGFAGDPLECAGLASVGWTIGAGGEARQLRSGEDTPVIAGSGNKPNGGMTPPSPAGSGSDAVEVLRRWPFASSLRRMTTVVSTTTAGGAGSARVLCKGAPEAIEKLLHTVPEGFSEAATALSLAGARVIALAWKPIKLPATSSKSALKAAIAALSREEVEADLRSAGLLVLDCPLKPDSEAVVTALREANEAVLMITGDHPLTAVAVSRKVGILPAPIDGVSLLPPEASPPVSSSAAAAPAASGWGGLHASGRRSAHSAVRILEIKPAEAASASSSAPAEARWQVVTSVAGRGPSVSYEALDVAALASTPLRDLFPGEDVCVTGSGLAPVLAQADAEAMAGSAAKSGGSDDDKEDASAAAAVSDSQLLWATMGTHQRAVARLCGECTVFARVAPVQKERIITFLNSLGKGTLMCGDGTNDVGALKQAGVGISIVSDPELEDRLDQIESEKALLIDAAQQFRPKPGARGVPAMTAEEQAAAVEQVESALRKRKQAAEDRLADKSADAKRKRKVLAVGDGFDSDSDEDAKLAMVASAKGGGKAKKGKRSAWTDPVKLVKQQLKLQKIPRESPEGRRRLANARMQREFREMEKEMSLEANMVQFGDASIAAPFTSKRPSPRVALDIMLQGRCTLVTTHQMFRILAVNSLVASYTLSALYLHGARTGDTQATVTGIAMSAFFMMLTFTKPLDKLSKAKPDTTVFTSPLLISVFGQFIIHLSAMMLAVHLCEPYVEFVPNPFAIKEETIKGPSMAHTTLSVVDDTAAAAAAAAAAQLAAGDEDGDWETGWSAGSDGGSILATPVPAAAVAQTADTASWLSGHVDEVTMDSTFTPNVLNSVVFLITTVQQATTFAVNYRGRPFMPDFLENKTFSYGLLALYALAFLAAFDMLGLQETLELVPMPNEFMSQAVIAIMTVDVVSCFGLEYGLRRFYKVPTE
jgi:predicted P-type ATPase